MTLAESYQPLDIPQGLVRVTPRRSDKKTRSAAAPAPAKPPAVAAPRVAPPRASPPSKPIATPEDLTVFMTRYGLTAKGLSLKVGKAGSYFTQVLAGKFGISPLSAARLHSIRLVLDAGTPFEAIPAFVDDSPSVPHAAAKPKQRPIPPGPPPPPRPKPRTPADDVSDQQVAAALDLLVRADVISKPEGYRLLMRRRGR